jgi:hypothetical protein
MEATPGVRDPEEDPEGDVALLLLPLLLLLFPLE